MKITKRRLLWCLPLTIIMCQCNNQIENSNALFQLLSSIETGVDFENGIIPDSTYNLLDFEYLYNGGGVGVGDFDNNGLPDLIFTGNMVESQIYLNKEEFQFENITQSSGFNTEGKWCTGVAIVDINCDGYDDVYVSVGGPKNESIYPNLLFINQKNLTFKEYGIEYGLADLNQTNQALFFDYDLDGDLDVYLLNGGGFEKSAITIRPILKNGQGRNSDKLYQNNFDEEKGHAVYTDVSAEAGITIEGFGLGVAMLDANRDKFPDIYVSNDYLSRDLLYVNNQDGTFTESAESYFDHFSHFSMGNDVGDINNDGRFDLVTMDMLPDSYFRRKTMFGPDRYDHFYQAVQYGYGYQYMRNMLHIGNDDEKGFSEVGQMAGIDRSDWSWSPLLADLDNDGFQDLYITNGYGKDVTDLDYVKFRNNAVSGFSKPEDVRKLILEQHETLPAIILPNYVFKNMGNYNFTKKIVDWGFTQPSISTGVAYVDLDQDGDLEIITNNINQKAFIYKNNTREGDSLAANFLNIKLNGSQKNQDGIGAKVELTFDGKKQVRFQQTSRGFQSSVTDELHFGLGNIVEIEKIEVTWPDGKKSIVINISANQLLTIDYKEASLKEPEIEKQSEESLLQKADLVSFSHQELPSVNDFKNQPLLLHGFSNQGPCIIVGDVNGDDLEDFIIGGAYGQSMSLFLQTNNETFDEKQISSEDYEDVGALLFDMDGDLDLDLYVTSGGAERYAGHKNYQDRIYENDGVGNFTLNLAILPEMLESTSTVVGEDFDDDGDIDLFVGGRVVPGKFPKAPKSFLLVNEDGKFVNATKALCPKLDSIGMVTAAIWEDYNGDGLNDLIIVGEMMKISVFQNDGKTFENMTDKVGLENSTGMWNCITSGDFDMDGDMDFVVGNIGQNTPYDISITQPLELHYADFDKNGSVDPIYSTYEEGEYYPLASYDLLVQQLTIIRKKIQRYKTFAEATTNDILNLLGGEYQTLKCEIQTTVLLENNGGSFTIKPLPLMAQLAPVKSILAQDLNLDGLLDLILVGNEYQTEVVNGRYDASQGTVLLNQGALEFEILGMKKSGLNILGDARSIVNVTVGMNKNLILIGKNKGQLDCYNYINHLDQKNTIN